MATRYQTSITQHRHKIMTTNQFPQAHSRPFHFHLPMLASMLQRSSGAPSELSNSKPLSTGVPQGLRVLVLEDNVGLARMLREFLEKTGYRPAVAHLGGEALRLLEEQEFQLALVDIDLPDTTGFEVVAKALAQGKLQGTKIIFCSGDPSEARVARARQFQGAAFLPKPFGIIDLTSVIRQMFQP